MGKKTTIVCPHCASTQSVILTFSTGSGSQPVQCRKCLKPFRIYFVGGEIDRVK